MHLGWLEEGFTVASLDYLKNPLVSLGRYCLNLVALRSCRNESETNRPSPLNGVGASYAAQVVLVPAEAARGGRIHLDVSVLTHVFM